MRMKEFLSTCVLLGLIGSIAFCQEEHTQSLAAYVDSSGVMRWKNTNEEISLFGVNYTAPFAYAFRAHKRLGLPIKKAIDLDVANMARLGLDAFRVHVWDREISDKDGNILQNEHLDVFDYLLARLAEHGIKAIITPIAWWGNGWPEPDEKTSGFSQSYPRLELITNPKAREAERTYLRQFINHVNPYNKLAYKTDTSIIAVEIINEPTHPENIQAVTDYINEMAEVLRNSGCKKPIFYNISQNWSQDQANAVANSIVDGVSFQWYPTDLVHGKMLTGNYLINVDHYAIPSDNVVKFGTKARMVYEFDAADVGG
jgi:endo-1,4-beta-mannosidase